MLVWIVALLAASSAMAQEVWIFDNIETIGGHKAEVLGSPRVIDTKIGKAVEFDGVDDALFFNVHPLAGAETFTWEVVFRPASGGGAEQRFFHMQEEGSQTRLLLETRLTGSHWYLDSFVFTSAGSRTLIDRTKLHPLDEWYHVAMVFDGRELRHYVNRVLQGSGPLAFVPQKAGRTSVGVRINLRDYFKGAIRMARMSRRALAVDEFLALP